VDRENLNRAAETTIPLMEEALRVRKRVTETGRVRVSVETEMEERVLRETLRGQRAEVERVTINRELEPGETAPVERREEDGTLVLPVLEEVLVVERRLVLREEIRIRTVATQEMYEATIPLRRQRAAVETSHDAEKHSADNREDMSASSRSAAQLSSTK